MQRWWHTVKGRNATIRQETIKNCHSKLLTTGSVTDARRIGRPSASRSENVALVRDRFTRSQRKSTREAARESGLSRHTVRTVLKKDLNFRPRKPHYVQELTPEDWPQNGIWGVDAGLARGVAKTLSLHNCHYWAAHDPEVTVEKMQNRQKVTVWCGMTATRVIGPYLLRDTMNAERYLQMLEDYVSYRIWLGKHRWTCFHARRRTAALCTERTCLVGSEVSGTLAGTTWTSRMAWKKSRSHALWLFPVGLGKGGSVPGKTSHNWTIGGPDSGSYRQRPTWLPAEDCRFHPRSFEEAGGCRRCLHWILSYASIFQFRKVHVKIIFVIFALEI